MPVGAATYRELSEVKKILKKLGFIEFDPDTKSWTCTIDREKNLTMRNASYREKGTSSSVMNHYRLHHRELYREKRREVNNAERQWAIQGY